MKNLSPIQRFVLRDLYTAESGLQAYTFWRRYRVSPAELSRVLIKFIDEGIVEFDNSTRVKMTEKGREWLTQNRIVLFYNLDAKPWRKCPDQFKEPPLSPNQPYIPSLSMLDKSLLPDEGQHFGNEENNGGEHKS